MGMTGPKPLARKTLLGKALIAIILVGSAVSACSGTSSSASGTTPTPSASASPSARPLTEAEADRMAVARFRNFETKGVKFSALFPAGSSMWSAIGYVDYRARVGYAVIRDTKAATANDPVNLAQWNDKSVVSWSGHYTGSVPPATLPTAPGESRALAPGSNTGDVFLALMLALGTDRPENAQLLRQSTALWQRSDHVGATAVDVFSGPAAPGTVQASRSTYWLDERGRMVRFETFTSGPVSVDFTPSDYQPFAIAKALG